MTDTKREERGGEKVSTSSNGSEEGERVGRKVERYLLTGTTTSEACIRFWYLHLHHVFLLSYGFFSYALFLVWFPNLRRRESKYGSQSQRGNERKQIHLRRIKTGDIPCHFKDVNCTKGVCSIYHWSST